MDAVVNKYETEEFTRLFIYKHIYYDPIDKNYFFYFNTIELVVLFFPIP